MNLRLAHFAWLRRVIISIMRTVYVKGFGMDLHPTCQFSLSARFDKTNPRGVHVGAHTYIAFDAVILTHDLTRGVRLHTRVGSNCFIGARSIILPGVRVGDNAIVGAGAVVNRDVPARTIVAGNPAKVIREDIDAGRYGRLAGADEVQRRQAAENGLD
ncbi:acyltransferase [Noviherbaspirillum sp.]|jgi:acetyltransferase-like isoleucine patch superfamily enzyme|uniref:acyltransferase n=1 Tax=Noviherbaspirillum sp. TaxID=1926288 RepID=UPI002F942917